MAEFLDDDGVLNSTDYMVLVIFLFVTLLICFTVGYRMRHKSLLAITFAGRNLGFLTIAFSTDLPKGGLARLTGDSSWAVKSGIGIYAFPLVAVLGILALGWFFMPVYMASGSLTTIDYAKKRFGGKRIEIAMVILMLIINVVSQVSVELHAVSVMVYNLFHIENGMLHVSVVACSMILVSAGGLFTLVYTNIWSFCFYATGAPVIFFFSYTSLKSWEDVVAKYQRSWPSSTIEQVARGKGNRYTQCGIPDKFSNDIIRPYDDPVLPWPGMLFGNLIIAIYNFCIDQSLLQFCFCGKNIVQVKCACVTSGFFKILNIFLIIPGFIARILFTDTVACADPSLCQKLCGQRSGCGDLALPLLFQKVIPPSWRGLVLSGFFAGSLASIATTFHAGSTIFIFNLYRPLRPGAKENELTTAGKLAVVVQGILGLVFLEFVNGIPHVDQFIQRVYSSLVPPLVSVYLFAIFWDRITERLAFQTLVLGSCIAFIRLMWSMSYNEVPCGDEARFPIPDLLDKFHDLHFAIFLFVICSSYIVTNGMTCEPIARKHLYRLLFWLRYSRLDRDELETVVIVPQKVKSVKSVSLVKKDEELEEDSEVDFSVDPDDYSTEDEQTSLAPENRPGEFDQDVAATQGRCGNCGALSNREITDDLLRQAMKEKTSILEKQRQSSALNMFLVLLLLVVTFVMAFFT